MPAKADVVGCHEFHRDVCLNRRSFVKAGILGSTGLSLADLLRHEARATNSSISRRPSVIILWMRGGPSHIDMWDPKPDAPAEYRGEFGVARTNVPGILLCDMLPRCGRIMDKWSIIRSLHHHDAGHSSGDQICFTGYNAGPNPDENIMPCCGSIVSRQLGHLTPHLPAYVMIPRLVPGTGSAYLGVAHKAFETQVDPANPGPFQVPNFTLPQGVTLERVGDRRQILRGFDTIRRDLDNTGQMTALDRSHQQAWDILTSSAARDAFDLDREPAHIRDRYGFMPAFNPMAANRCGAPAWSQRILLARRLVEAGVRLVTVDLRWWDTHVLGFESLRLGFLPRFDPGAANRCGAPAWSQRILLARRLVEAGVRLVTVDLRWWDTHVLGFEPPWPVARSRAAASSATPIPAAPSPGTTPNPRKTCSPPCTATSASMSPCSTPTTPADRIRCCPADGRLMN